MSISHSQPIKSQPTQTPCFCLPFVTLARWARICLADIAEFFRNLFCSTRSLDPNRITTTSPQTPPTQPTPLEQPQPIPLEQPTIPTLSTQQIPKPVDGGRCLPSHLIDFYNGAINDEGVTLTFLLEQADDLYLEDKHHWVQWAFPLKVPGVNPTAPILDQGTIDHFRANPHLQEKLVKMFKRVLQFFGLQLDEKSAAVIKGENFDERAPVNWFQDDDHNHLRITRILECLQLLQDPASPSLSIAFFRFLKDIQQQQPKVSTINFSYWQKVHPTL